MPKIYPAFLVTQVPLKIHAADSEISVLAHGFPNCELLHTLIQPTKTSDP